MACDIPSGVDADTGEAHAPVLRAELTVTFGAAKAGLLADPGADFAGRVQVIPIGIEAALPEPALRRFEAGDLPRCCPIPERRSHKYSRGVLGVVAGSQRYPGAAVLACRGALAAGVGHGALPWPAGRRRPGPPVLPRSRVRHRQRRGRPRPGLARWARGSTKTPTSSWSASATPQPPGCPSWPTPGRCRPCPAPSPRGSC